jgi:DNA-binding NtrC family response regulator
MMPVNESSPLHSPQSSLLQRKVLMVDDDPKDLNDFSSLLERMGCRVEAFASHREAEGCLGRGHFDLVILSHGRTVLEARRLLRFILRLNRFTPVVVVTRYAEIEYYIEAMQLGASDYLEKPLSPLQLERLVATYCKSHQDEIPSNPESRS